MSMRYDDHQKGDELDHLLGAFFRAEMPEPWPAPEVESARVLRVCTPRRGQSPARGRLALAASIALLIAGSFFLADRFGNGSSSPGASPDIRLEGPATSKRQKEPPMKEWLEDSHDLEKSMVK